jgi:hypothetical protein
MPMTTLGMPARISRQIPITVAILAGSFSTTMTAAPTAIGSPTRIAIADDSSVPAMSGQAPNSAPKRWATPPEWTIVLYVSPFVHTLELRKCQPL